MPPPFPGKQALRSPSQLSPESQLNYAERKIPRLNSLDPINRQLEVYWPCDGSTQLIASVDGVNGTRDVTPNQRRGAFAATGYVLDVGRIGQTFRYTGSVGLDCVFSATTVFPFLGLSCWIKTTLAGGPSQILNGDSLASGAGGRLWQFRLNSNVIEFIPFNSAGSNGSVGGTTVVNDGAWHHVGASWDGVTAIVYVDGRIDGSAAFAGSALALVANSAFGANSQTFGSADFIGSIDDIRVWSRAPTPAEFVRIASDTTGNLGVLAPVRALVGATSVTPSGRPRIFFLGGGLLASALIKNPTTSRRKIWKGLLG